MEVNPHSPLVLVALTGLVARATKRRGLASHQFGLWVVLDPLLPAYFVRGELGQFSILELTLDAGHAVITESVVPQTLCLKIVEDERVVERPTTRTKGKHSPVYFSAVHGSQFDEWSPPDGNVHISERIVAHFV